MFLVYVPISNDTLADFFFLTLDDRLFKHLLSRKHDVLKCLVLRMILWFQQFHKISLDFLATVKTISHSIIATKIKLETEALHCFLGELKDPLFPAVLTFALLDDDILGKSGSFNRIISRKFLELICFLRGKQFMQKLCSKP